MAIHGNRDQQSDAPLVQADDKGNSGQDQYGNTVFGVDVTEAGVTDGVAGPGWVKRTVGYGALTSVAITAAGTGYANSDTFAITATEAGGVDVAGTIETDGSGVITSVTVTEFGSGFDGSETVAITTGGGSGATLTPTYGGRAGRIHYETLSTCKIQGDSISFSNTSTTTIANSTGTADDAIFPDT